MLEGVGHDVLIWEDGRLLVPKTAVGRLSLPSDRSFADYAVAVAHVIRPDLLESRELNVEIDRESELCRGRTVVDVWKRTGREPNARVAVGIDADGFIELLLDRLGSLDDVAGTVPERGLSQ